MKSIICEAFDGTNLSTRELNNSIDEMSLFHKDNLSIVNRSAISRYSKQRWPWT